MGFTKDKSFCLPRFFVKQSARFWSDLMKRNLNTPAAMHDLTLWYERALCRLFNLEWGIVVEVTTDWLSPNM